MNILSHIVDAEMVMRIRLEPSGCHTLQVAFVGHTNEFILSVDQARQLSVGIREFESECTFDDARPIDRTHPKTCPVGR